MSLFKDLKAIEVISPKALETKCNRLQNQLESIQKINSELTSSVELLKAKLQIANSKKAVFSKWKNFYREKVNDLKLDAKADEYMLWCEQQENFQLKSQLENLFQPKSQLKLAAKTKKGKSK